MSLEKDLEKRSEGKCEVCGANSALFVYEIPPVETSTLNNSIFVCETCNSQIADNTKIDTNHWRCLNDSMWSQVPAVQVMAWRMLNRLHKEDWALSLLEMLYLDDETLKWAKANGDDYTVEKLIHKDSNGNVLQNGDTVTLIKNLDVKGANFTAKRGTAVRKITLVADNAEHIEGKVEGQHIVILTKFVKKST